MGDRCNLSITFRKEDEERISAVWGSDWYDEVLDEGETWKTVFIDEVNYGMTQDREKLAQAGICFVGEHGPGGTYPSYVFAAYEGEHADVHGHEEKPFVTLKPDGSVNMDGLEEARLYLKLLKKAWDRLNGHGQTQEKEESK